MNLRQILSSLPRFRSQQRLLLMFDRILGPCPIKTNNGSVLKLFLSSTQDKAFVRNLIENPELSCYIDALPSAGVFIDIGANCGYYSAKAAIKMQNANALVVSIEPSRREYSRLVWATENNQHLGSWITINCAAGSASGVANIDCSTTHTGTNRIVTENGIDDPNGSSISTLMLTLDTLIEGCVGLSRNIDLVKIDVEGFEMEVLKGSIRVLSQQKVKTWSIEITDAFLTRNGSSKTELYEFMAGYGYLSMKKQDSWQYDEIFEVPTSQVCE